MRPITIIDISSDWTRLFATFPAGDAALEEHLTQAHDETVEAIIGHLDALELPPHRGFSRVTEEEREEYGCDLVAEQVAGIPGVRAGLILDAETLDLAPPIAKMDAAMGVIAEIAQGLQEARGYPNPGQITTETLLEHTFAREAMSVLSHSQIRSAVHDGYMTAVLASEEVQS